MNTITGLDRDQLAERNVLELEKLRAEELKLRAEELKIRTAEIAKLRAETEKINREKNWLPIAALIAAITAITVAFLK